MQLTICLRRYPAEFLRPTLYQLSFDVKINVCGIQIEMAELLLLFLSRTEAFQYAAMSAHRIDR